MSADPYTTLGVSKTATADEIKKAYRALAHKYHPDKKGGNAEKFKEVNEAYQILGDAEKRSQYDRFGHAGSDAFSGGQGFGGFGGGQGFGGFEDIFDMFGASFGGGARPAQRPQKGDDLYLEVPLTKKDFGQRKKYEYEALDACQECAGTGAKNGKLVPCTACNGQGQVRQTVRTPFGTFAHVVPCQACSGEGVVPQERCSACAGSGQKKTTRTIEIHIPETLDSRYVMALPRGGNAGPRGVPAGDLFVTLRKK